MEKRRIHRLVIIDLDGVVADSQERFAHAEREANARYNRVAEQRAWTALYWSTALDPQYVPLDCLIAGADTAITQLEQEAGDRTRVLYLTSRPETMRAATTEWLHSHRLGGPTLLMKPSAFQYIKTLVWKIGIVQMLGSSLGAEEVLVIDDEVTFLEELLMSRIAFPLRLYTDLTRAHEVRLPDEGDEDGEEDRCPF